MEYTSAEAAKLLRRLNEERDALELSERRRKVFTASLGEDPESVRPEYDYHQVQKEPDAQDGRIQIQTDPSIQFNPSMHLWHLTL